MVVSTARKDEYLSHDKAAELLVISQGDLRQLVARGKLQTSWIRGKYKFNRGEVERFADQRIEEARMRIAVATNTPFKPTQEHIDNWIARYTAGEPMVRIAIQAGLKARTVIDALAGRVGFRAPEPDWMTKARELREAGHTLKQIGPLVGKNVRLVSGALAGAGYRKPRTADIVLSVFKRSSDTAFQPEDVLAAWPKAAKPSLSLVRSEIRRLRANDLIVDEGNGWSAINLNA